MQYLPMVNKLVIGADLSTLMAPVTYRLMTKQLEDIKAEIEKLSSAISKIKLTSEERKLDRNVNDVQMATVLFNEPKVEIKAKYVKKTYSELFRQN